MLKEMDVWSKNPGMQWLRTCGATAILLLGWLVSMDAAGLEAYIPRKYEKISLDKLISVYRRAYENAGFRLTKRTSESFRMAVGGELIQRTHLYFEFSATKKLENSGAVFIEIDLPSTDEQNCAPCEVTQWPDPSRINAHGIERDLLIKRMSSAYNSALVEIDTKLSKFDTNRAEREESLKYRTPITSGIK